MKTFLKIVNWIFGEIPILSFLNGKKTEIGFALWLLSYVIEGLAIAGTMLPDVPVLMQIRDSLYQFHMAVTETLRQLGLGTLLVGAGHKVAKEKGEVVT